MIAWAVGLSFAVVVGHLANGHQPSALLSIGMNQEGVRQP
jgi:hypothetical protein